jgi:ComF family protein
MQKVGGFVIKKFVEWKENILHLIYPSVCLNCEKELSKFEENLCDECFQNLKLTSFENYKEATSLDKLFWGRIEVTRTYAFMYFEKENASQTILHQIKYKGNQNLGIKMGEIIGKNIPESIIQNIDALVPVPLHLKKLKSRGYNQSEVIAKGIEQITGKKIVTDFLIRKVHRESQTTKGRFQRWDNIEEVFFVNQLKDKKIKHIAIIDDVVTTGSTLESCVRLINSTNPELQISIIALAITK